MALSIVILQGIELYKEKAAKPCFSPDCNFCFSVLFYRATFMGAARSNSWQSHTLFWY